MRSRLAGIVALAGAQVAFAQTISSIGKSTQGRDIRLLTIAAPSGEDGRGADDRPALLIVSGINGQFTTGTRIAEGLAARLLAEHAGLLDRYTVYVVPLLNPDSAAWHEATAVKMLWPKSGRPTDDDHDGRIDEDGPVDLNGDGMITMMRVKHPPPGSDLRATLIADPKDPRILREPDPIKGEKAEYALLVEGRDLDGDGQIAEDGPGGVVFDRNFPARWPELEDGAGPFQLCEPETRALVDWMLARNNIVAVFVLGEHDTLVNVPVSGQMDSTGQVPLGIEEPDKKFYEEMSRLYKEITRINEAARPDSAGAFHTWSYAHFGVFTFSTPGWARPDQMRPEEKKDEPAPPPEATREGAEPGSPGLSDEQLQAEIRSRMAAFISGDEATRARMMSEFAQLPPDLQARVRQMAMAAGAPPGVFPTEPVRAAEPGVLSANGQPEALPPGGGGRRGRGGPGGPPGGGARPPGGDAQAGGATGDDAKWLEYIKTHLDGEGFVDWAPFDHPDLGLVEIGGFVPGVKLNAKESDLPSIIDAQTRFVAALIERLPMPRMDGVGVEDLSSGVWRVTVRIANDGLLPTRPAIGIKTRRLHPLLVTLEAPPERLLAGSPRQTQQSLAGSGGAFEAQWTVTGERGSSLTIRVRSAEFGTWTVPVTLDAEANR